MLNLRDRWLRFFYPFWNIPISVVLGVSYAAFSLIRWAFTGQSPIPALSNLVTPQAIFGVFAALATVATISVLAWQPFLTLCLIPLVLALIGQLAFRQWTSLNQPSARRTQASRGYHGPDRPS
jgi:hypothetical protein